MSVADQGTRLGGRYLVGASLGRGASAEVHDGWDELLQRPVAIKMLHPGADSLWSAERFCEEARTAARLSSPHVVTVHDFSADGDPYLVLERMSGRTWADELREAQHAGRRVPDSRVYEVLRAVLGALAEARALDIVHRDVKPGNVMLTDDGVPKLGDFGIAKSAGGDALTRTGEVLGSFAYIAPERARGESATPASDIWSVGIMAYEALTGRRPFTGDSPATVVHTVLTGDYVPIDDLRPDLPVDVRQAVTRALSADPTSRPSPPELITAFSGTTAPAVAAPVTAVPILAASTAPSSAADDALSATAALATMPPPVLTRLGPAWRRGGARTAVVLVGAVAALVLVVALIGQAATGPSSNVTPSPGTSVTPVATPSGTPTTSRPKASATTRPATTKAVVQAPSNKAKGKSKDKGKGKGKAKGRHKPKK